MKNCLFLVLLACCCLLPSTLSAQQNSVKPGINDKFNNLSDEDLSSFVERFESEGREIFDMRKDIVDACKLRPAMVVADIGAGTGLFTQMIAPKVAGAEVTESDNEKVTVVAPTWRNDLTREIDLVEEVGRIYGFENVPDTALVPMAASFTQKTDRVLGKVRDVLTAGGYNEAICPSIIPGKWSESFSPWSSEPAIRSSQPMPGVLEKASRDSC